MMATESTEYTEEKCYNLCVLYGKFEKQISHKTKIKFTD
jgi:hypothetical protein